MSAGLPSGAETFSSAIADAVGYARWIIDAFAPYFGPRLMEVGLGHGGYRSLLPPLDFYLGVDIDAACIARARASNPGEAYIQADITSDDLLAQLTGHRIDTVLCFNVLEHIPDDRRAVSNLLDAVVPGGHVLIFVPAFQTLYTEMDRLAGHLRRYRTATLRSIVPADRGEVIEARYFNGLGGLGWFANRFAGHKSLNAWSVIAQIRMFDRYVLPIARLVDPLTSTFFGQSALCVVRKK